MDTSHPTPLKPNISPPTKEGRVYLEILCLQPDKVVTNRKERGDRRGEGEGEGRGMLLVDTLIIHQLVSLTKEYEQVFMSVVMMMMMMMMLV